MKHRLFLFLILLLTGFALTSCDKENCYECTKVIGAETVVKENCDADRTGLRIWKEDLESRDYSCEKK